jgi:hypothetical protein
MDFIARMNSDLLRATITNAAKALPTEAGG